MGAGGVLPIIEEGTSTELKQGFQNLFTHGGEAFLRSLGQHGEFLAEHLKGFEAFKARNTSTARETVSGIFKEVPAQHHQDLENAVLKKPNNLPVQYTQQAQKLDRVQNVITSKSQQAGITTNIGGQNIPIVLHPEGPYAHHPDILKANTPTRKAAISEVMLMHNLGAVEAGKKLNEIVTPQFGRNGASHISFPYNSQLINSGRLPIAQRWSRWAEASADKVAQNTFFGVDDVHLKAITDTILRTKGAVSANNVMDFLNVYQHNPAYERTFGLPKAGVDGAESLLRKVSGYIMTSRIALPHATQINNSILNEGFRKTLAGIWDRTTNWKQYNTLVMESGAMEEELHREFQSQVQGEKSWFEKAFHQPGFDQIRKWQASVAAIAGKHEMESAAKEFLAGTGHKAGQGAEATLQRLGVDTVELKRVGNVTDEMRKTAMYNAAKQTVFFRTPLNTPYLREKTALGRMAFMYSHYHFNMIRNIKNAFKDSWQEQGYLGLVKTAAKLGTLFPIAGGLIVALENGMYRRPLNTRDINPTGNPVADTYLNAMAHASAFGILYSINRASKRSLIENLVVGPWAATTISTGVDATDAIMGHQAKGRAGKYGQKTHDYKPIGRDVLRHIPVLGPTISGTLLPYKEKKGQGQ